MNFGKFKKDGILIKFYYNTAPNPAKVALFLEESGLAYEIVPVDTRKGEQHSVDYTAINPNAKVPAIDDDGVVVFDSNAILLYLAEKTGKFLPTDSPQARGQLYSWLMFIASGVGPYSGQAVHFRHFAPEPKTYALNRYDFEAWRHWEILDAHLASHRFMLGDEYTLVDMAFWGWARALPFVLGNAAWGKLPNAKRLLDDINARPAAQRADALKTQHAFKADMDESARSALFPQNARLQTTDLT
jgi:GST-like protein